MDAAEDKAASDVADQDEAFKLKPGTTLKDLQGSLPPVPVLDPKTFKPKMLEYVSLAVDKKFGEKLTDEECDKLGLPHGSVMPDPDLMIPPGFDDLPPGPLVPGTPRAPGLEVPPFTLDPEAELPGEEDIDHKGSTPAHHTEETETPLEGPRPTRTVDEVADEAKAVFDAMVDRGFSRAEALELVKEVVKVRAKE